MGVSGSIQRYNAVNSSSTEDSNSTVDITRKKEWKTDHTDNRLHGGLPDDIRKPVFCSIQ